MAEHRMYTCFAIFVGSPVLAQFFSIEFLQLFYAVLSLLELFFDIYFL